MEQVLFLLIRIVLIGCAVALTTVICQRLSVLNKKIKDSDRFPSVEGQLYEIERIIRYCIETTNQTFVNELKASGEWNKQRMTEAFNKTITTARNLLTKTTKEALERESIDVDKLLTVLIESYISGKKEARAYYDGTRIPTVG